MHTQLLNSADAARPARPATSHPTWKTTETGNCKDPNDALQYLKGLRVEVSPAAVKLIELICDGLGETSSTRLVLKTVSELGFKQPTELREVASAWALQGLTYCPKDTVVRVASSFSELPEGEVIRVMSVPVEVHGLPCSFRVSRRSTAISLNAVSCNKEDKLEPHERLVLAKSDTLRAD